MTKKAHTMKKGIALLVGCLVGIPAITQAAQERKSPLADAPAIRKRFELRANRLEVGVGLTQTIGQDFYTLIAEPSAWVSHHGLDRRQRLGRASQRHPELAQFIQRSIELSYRTRQ